MCAAIKLGPDQVHSPCSPEAIPFDTTREASSVNGMVIGQERAVEALRFGVGVRRRGYNVFAIGPPGLGKRALLEQLLARQAEHEDRPSDWCYVHDFAHPEKPRALELPPGMGVMLRRDMAAAVADLRVVMRSAFESEEYRARKQQRVKEFEDRQEQALTEVQERAKQRGVAVVHTDKGVAVAPFRNGETLDAARFHALPDDDRERIAAEMDRVGEELHDLLRRFHDWAREHREALKSIDRDTTAGSAREVLARLRTRYAELPAVLDYLSQVEVDVVDSADELLEGSAEGVEAILRQALKRDQGDSASFRRYQVNVLVDQSEQHGAPVVYEDNPTYPNLVGRVEHEAQFGALVTNFTLIKAGALHRAAGGYLILDALRVLRHPFAWEALKRTVESGEIRIESLGQALGLVPTVSLEPAAVPLGDTKLVLVGERLLYYLLAALDPDFLELFKVLVDFEETMDRAPEAQALYAQVVAWLVGKEGLRPFDRGAVARVIDHAARTAGDAEKLSVRMRGVVDLLQEADFFAGRRGRDVATADDVQAAIDAQLHRSGRVREKLQEAIRRGDLLVATTGERVGQVNGLSVYHLGEHLFGHPTRITARVRLGKGEVVDIEREVDLGGPLHSKGVLILGGLLGSRYAPSVPFSLSATLVFEQSYASVEGDSASLAELCALLSALADVPVQQSLAITGSVNQHGQVQSIGGVNEKIEGFFDACKQAGLTGEQGVLVPKSNIKNLMVRRDVAEAIEAGSFHVYAIEQVDDALEILTGRPAGDRDAAGRFPSGSVNALVEERLVEFAESARTHLARLPFGADVALPALGPASSIGDIPVQHESGTDPDEPDE